MALLQQLPNVHPGGLVKSDDINALINGLNDLAVRVALLEAAAPPGQGPASGPPAIDSIQPAGDVSIGTLLNINGRNFSPLSLTRVELGGVTIDQFGIGASPTSLPFQIPNRFPQLPLSTTVTVRTPQGPSNVVPIKLVAAGPLQAGEVFTDDLNTTSQGNITIGKTYTYQWRVRSETLEPDEYDFSATYTGVDPASTQAAWEANTALNVARQKIAAGAPVTVIVTVTVPAGASKANLVFTAKSTTDAKRLRSANAIALVVGSTSPVSSGQIDVVVEKPTPADPVTSVFPNPVTMATGPDGAPIIQVKHGASGWIPVLMTFKDSALGRYRFSASIEDAGSPVRWQTSTTEPQLFDTLAGGTKTKEVLYDISNTGSAASPPPDTFMVVKAARRKSGDTADDYVSFSRFRIRGIA
jgi:hypothetical protein